MSTRFSRFKGAFANREAFVHFLQAPPPEGQEHLSESDRKHVWSNLDLAPSPPQDRKWGGVTYAAFWAAHAANISVWMSGSSIISLGLDPLSTWLTLATSHILVCALLVINGRGPARYHIGFPVMARSVYGLWGSYFAVLLRAVFCVLLAGYSGYYGGRILTVAITAIWPQYRHLPNIIPESQAINSKDLCSYFLFMIAYLALSFVHSRDLKYFYWAKSIVVFIAMQGVLAWWMKKSGGVSFTTLANEKPLSTTDKTWLVLNCFNLGLSTGSSLTVNQGDIARYARTPGSQMWLTLCTYPIFSAIPCLYGILVASAAKKMTGSAIWNMWDTLDYMLLQYPDNHGARFGIFLAAFSMALAYLGITMATNSLPFGSDVTALFPRWMTIRRGQVLCTVLSFATVPWKLLNSAKQFVNFLNGYSLFLAPLAACLMCDYFFIKRGNINVPELYNGETTGRYWYYRGYNPRAIISVILAITIGLPSFAANIDPEGVSLGLTTKRLFYLCFVLSYVVATLLLYLSYVIWPDRNASDTERSMRFEQMADDFDLAEREGGRYGEPQAVKGADAFEDPEKTNTIGTQVLSVD